MDFAVARRNMVEGQLRPNRVTEPKLVEALASVPREEFVPKAWRPLAYVDEDIAVATGRYLMEPVVLGRLLDAAAIRPEDVTLSIGCASGYSVAVLARLANTVFGLESDRDLARTAGDLLGRLGIDNGVLIEGPLEDGWPKEAPYNVILIDGAVARLPAAILGQLAEGGRLVTVMREGPGMGRATLFVQQHGSVSRRVLFDAAVPLLPGFKPVEGFVF